MLGHEKMWLLHSSKLAPPFDAAASLQKVAPASEKLRRTIRYHYRHTPPIGAPGAYTGAHSSSTCPGHSFRRALVVKIQLVPAQDSKASDPHRSYVALIPTPSTPQVSLHAGQYLNLSRCISSKCFRTCSPVTPLGLVSLGLHGAASCIYNFTSSSYVFNHQTATSINGYACQFPG